VYRSTVDALSVRLPRPVRALAPIFTEGLSRAARTWWLAPALVAGVVVDDAVLVPRSPSYLVLGILDEPAHLATSAVLLLAIGAATRRLTGRPLPPAYAAALLVAGNLIDFDHVPAFLGSMAITDGTPRPYSHSLLTVGLLAAVAAVAAAIGRRLPTRLPLAAIALGAATGVAGHLLRDVATAPVALLWPWSSDGLTVRHRYYLVALAIAALVAVAGAISRSALNPSRDGADTPT
jgi:membrane-bound metal-dependent hydrolase YbcI (DUF457 family)